MTDSDKNSTKILLTVFLTIFIDMLGIGVLIPVMPLLVLPTSPFRITPDEWSIASGFILLGWLSTSFPLALMTLANFSPYHLNINEMLRMCVLLSYGDFETFVV